MNGRIKLFWDRVRAAGPFSATSFAARAAMIVVAYAVSRAAGLQEYTTFLSGTPPNPRLSWQVGATLGMIHLFLYFAFVLLAPIFLMTAGALSGWARWRAGPDK